MNNNNRMDNNQAGLMNAVQKEFNANGHNNPLSLSESKNSLTWHKLVESGGVPSKDNEEYKYSPADKIFKDCFPVVKKSVELKVSDKYNDLDGIKLVFLNGVLLKERSQLNLLPKGFFISDFSEFNQENLKDFFTQNYFSENQNDTFSLLINGENKDGYVIWVEPQTEVQKPIHLVHYFSADKLDIITSRGIVVLNKQSKCTLFETFQSSETGIRILNKLQVLIKPNSRLAHYRIQDTGTDSYLVDNLEVNADENSVYNSCNSCISGSWIRNNHQVNLNGKNTEIHLNGLKLISDQMHADSHTLVDHRIGDSQSNQLFKAILTGKAEGVFNGKIFVRDGASKTNAYQSSKSILLSDDASMNAKPQLEIYNDDVKCSHGSSTGSLSDDAMFYLASRGIGKENAQRLLLKAFAGEVLSNVDELSYTEKILHLTEKFLEV